jgi:dihydropteroate synthase
MQAAAVRASENHASGASGGVRRAAFQVMGVVNVTPDSFSDGGRYLDPRQAAAHGLELAAQGALILDVGGESTRPGADPVQAEEESRRVVPVIEALVSAGVGAQISVDTMKASVAERALAVGASLVNDVTALRAAPELAEIVAAAGADICLMHMRHMPDQPTARVRYEDVVADFPAAARRIVAHCGLDWDEACLDFYRTARPVRTASVVQVRQPIYRSSVGRWRPDAATLRPLLAGLGLDDAA